MNCEKPPPGARFPRRAPGATPAKMLVRINHQNRSFFEMADIKVGAREGLIQFDIQDQSGHGVSFAIDPDDAEALALAALQVVGKERGPQTQSLLEQTPMASQHNPRMEHTRRDDGKFLLAVQVGQWRPILLILDKGWVVDMS